MNILKYFDAAIPRTHNTPKLLFKNIDYCAIRFSKRPLFGNNKQTRMATLLVIQNMCAFMAMVLLT